MALRIPVLLSANLTTALLLQNQQIRFHNKYFIICDVLIVE